MTSRLQKNNVLHLKYFFKSEYEIEMHVYKYCDDEKCSFLDLIE